MNIVIIGCGKVGATLAEQLNNEGHNITIVDKNEKVLKNIATKLDVMGVTGNGAMLEVQSEAGVSSADVLIAVTDSDELNMLCCLIAKQMGYANTVARIRNPEYEREIDYIKKELNISMVINPEKMVAQEIVRLIRFPFAREIETFAQDRVDMVKVRINEKSKLCDTLLKDLSKKTKANALICIVERGSDVIIPSGLTELKAGDFISFIAKPTDAMMFCKDCSIDFEPIRTAFIIGGGRIAYYVTVLTEARRNRCQLKVIELNAERANFLAARFPDLTVINGDGSSQQLLEEEGIQNADAIVSMTGIDEVNVITSLFASKLSNARLITKVNHLNPSSVEDLQIGSIVCPKNVTSDEVVRYVRGLENSKGINIETLYKVANGKVEACEFIVSDDKRIVNIPFITLNLKKNVLVGAIIRKNQVFNPGGQDYLMPGDHVVIITTNTGITDLTDILA